jgi:hypothetical protein
VANLTIDFGENGGGRREFPSAQALLDHLRDEYDSWRATFPRPNADPSGPLKRLLEEVQTPWMHAYGELERTLGSAHADPARPFLKESTDNHIAFRVMNEALRQFTYVAVGSPTGAIITSIFSKYGPHQALGAARVAVAQSVDGTEEATTWEKDGALIFRMRRLGLLQEGQDSLGGDVGAATEIMQRHLSDIVNIREVAVVEAETAKHAVQAAVNSAEKTLIEHRIQTDRDFVEFRDKISEEWSNTRDAYSEQLKLQAPVTLWKSRATEYSTSSRGRLVVAIVTGIVGLVATVFVTWSTFVLARRMFASATFGDVPVDANGLRVTFHYELLIATAATLLFLTMFLWALRIVVRMYMTEHHLAIDAKARATLVETYLSLTKEGGASDADRAIILASLFRPVTDGMVKEDAMPMLSPAAILSAAAAGKTGGAAS